jgi:hypothetical protein
MSGTGTSVRGMLQASTTKFDIVKAVLPVITFLLGIFVSQLDKWRDLRRKVRNIRTMLRQELVEDYRLLNAIITRPDQRQVVGDFYLAASIASSISSSIYDSYLSKLDELSSQDLDAVYNAYLSIKNLRRFADRFLAEEQDAKTKQQLASLATTVVVTANTALGKTKDALARLATDPAVMASQEAQRGVAFDNRIEIESGL